jgi:hypothetical protein
MQQPESIAQLILAFMADKLSDSQAADLTGWRQASTDNEALFQRLTDQEVFWNTWQEAKDTEGLVWEQICNTIRSTDAIPFLPVNWPAEMLLGRITLMKDQTQQVKDKKR